MLQAKQSRENLNFFSGFFCPKSSRVRSARGAADKTHTNIMGVACGGRLQLQRMYLYIIM